ncbi:hypothetical protein CDV31_010399 [Fusarium ambrosium]|uniref:Ketoreductase (KR) domain-containing protein n=1 Tax=Fusarium ambrosium TaxID=131363 RepID=A0A428TNQ6_9HYPO|nr:hypothetical protein CDV31_010399 [Fusarium ambrosium]
MATTFDISPEWRASQLHFYYRQLFITPSLVSPRDADLSGRTAIVTGSNTGLGLEIARQLLDLGCKVILAVRDEAKGERARQELINGRDLPSEFVEVWKLDMLSYESIMDFAKRTESLQNLDIAILNAGVQKGVETFTSTGYEEGLQVNYLSTMLLAILLLPIVKQKRVGNSAGQICILSSDMAAWSRMAPIAYKTEGLRLAKQLYEETLDELSFAGVRDIINDL